MNIETSGRTPEMYKDIRANVREMTSKKGQIDDKTGVGN